MGNIFKIIFLLFFITVSIFAVNSNLNTNKNLLNSKDSKALAEENNSSDNEADYKILQDKYKEGLKKVTPELEKEIVTYRKKEAGLSKSKNILYNNLSEEAQNSLKKDADFKKLLIKTKYKLPKNQTKEELELYSNSFKDHEKAIKDYQLFLGSMDPKINKEIEEYRVAVKDINKEKAQDYKKLSSKAKAFFKREDSYRKKLQKNKNSADEREEAKKIENRDDSKKSLTDQNQQTSK